MDKKRFFDDKDENVLAITTTYKCNEWLDKSDIDKFEYMKIHNPKRYQVAGEGEWGIVNGLVYENWQELEFDYKSMINQNGFVLKNGLDFGYTQDPTAFINCLLNEEKKKYIYLMSTFKKVL